MSQLSSQMAKLSVQATSAQHMYNARASNYDDSFHPRFAQHIVDSLNLQPGERVLDLACGTGLVTLPAAKAVGATGLVVGVDITDGMLAELKRKIAASPEQFKHVDVHHHDITKLAEIKELEKNNFDAITLASCLVLLREPGLALLQWKDYLKPSGRLITDTTDIGNMPSSIAMERVYNRMGLEFPSNRLWAVDGTSLKQKLMQAGFEVEKVWFEKSTGAPTKYHEKGAWEGIFVDMITKPPMKTLSESGRVEEARPLFKEEWERLAIHDGKVRETDGVWVALARKPAGEGKVTARGSCACATIKWSTTADSPAHSSNCLCTTCRKISGSPYQTFFDIPTWQLTFDPPFGMPHLKTFQRSQHAERTFCCQCGSTLTMWYRNKPDVISLAAGTLDEDESEEGWYKGPDNHIYISEKPKWFEVPDDGKRRNETMHDPDSLLTERPWAGKD